MIKKEYRRPMLAALAVYTIWGFSFFASKLGQASASPLLILMYRFDIATLVMLVPLVLGKRRVSFRGKDMRGMLLLGLCEPVIYFVGEQYGLKYTNSAFSGVMISVIPIVTLILAAVFIRERPTAAQWGFSALSIAGVAGVTLIAGGSGEIRPLGVVLLALAVITGAAYSVISRGISGDFSVYERSLIMQAMGAVFYTALALAECRGQLDAVVRPLGSGGFIFAVLYLSLGASVAGYSLFNYAVANAPMANVTILCNLTTVLSVLAGVLILGEPFSWLSAVCLAVILAGIWGVERFGPREPEAEAEIKAGDGSM